MVKSDAVSKMGIFKTEFLSFLIHFFDEVGFGVSIVFSEGNGCVVG